LHCCLQVLSFVRDLYKGALVGYIPSYLAQGVVYMTPQMFKTESVVDTVRRLHNYFLKDSTFKSIDGVCSILRTVVILYAAAIDSIIMLRYVKDRYYAKPVSPEVTDPVLLALLKRRNNDKATLGKRMINLAVSLSTCLTLTSWEAIVSVTSLMPLSCAPAMCMMHQALHCGLVFYQTHYRYRLMEVRRGAVTFWGKVTTLEGAKKRNG
jgi:hypothetical protein